MYNFNKQRLDAIEMLMAPGDLLDVGCGPDLFMLSAHDRGWRVKGVDISATAVGFAGASYGLEVTEGQLETASFSNQSFDLIAAWQLLEHTSKPLVTQTCEKIVETRRASCRRSPEPEQSCWKTEGKEILRLRTSQVPQVLLHLHVYPQTLEKSWVRQDHPLGLPVQR